MKINVMGVKIIPTNRLFTITTRFSYDRKGLTYSFIRTFGFFTWS